MAFGDDTLSPPLSAYQGVFEASKPPVPSTFKGIRVHCPGWRSGLGKPCGNVLAVSRWFSGSDLAVEGFPSGQVIPGGSRSRPHLNLALNGEGSIESIGCRCGYVWQVDASALAGAFAEALRSTDTREAWIDIEAPTTVSA